MRPMKRAVVTFDFHDTLVHCDDWFQLEVVRLPSAFLAWHESTHGPLAGVDTGQHVDRAYRRLRTAILQHGHELSAERSIALIYRQAGIRVSDEIVADGVRALMRNALPGAHPVAGAVGTVRALHAAGITLAVISSAVHHPFLEWALHKVDLIGTFRLITTSASTGYYKSRPELYWQTLDALDADRSRSVHVGDSARFDVDSAARAGMQAVWLDRGGESKPTTEPALTLQSLAGAAPRLLDLVQRRS